MDTSTKTCTKCGQTFPATTEYFHKQPKGRFGLSARCKLCKRKYNAYYYAINLESEKQRRRKYYSGNRNRVLEHASQYRASHRGEILKAQKAWRENNVEHRLAYAKRYNHGYYINNRQKIRAQSAEYYHKHKYEEQFRQSQLANTRNRRSRIRATPGTHTAADIQAQIAAQTDKQGNLHCWLCGKPIKGKCHVDHWTPLAKGGTNNPENIRILHIRCNLSKNTKLPSEYGRLL